LVGGHHQQIDIREAIPIALDAEEIRHTRWHC
jgi:hypothetical protein